MCLGGNDGDTHADASVHKIHGVAGGGSFSLAAHDFFVNRLAESLD